MFVFVCVCVSVNLVIIIRNAYIKYRSIWLIPGRVPAKELVSYFFIKKVDNIRNDIQTRQQQMYDNAPDVHTAMFEILADF